MDSSQTRRGPARYRPPLAMGPKISIPRSYFTFYWYLSKVIHHGVMADRVVQAVIVGVTDRFMKVFTIA